MVRPLPYLRGQVSDELRVLDDDVRRERVGADGHLWIPYSAESQQHGRGSSQVSEPQTAESGFGMCGEGFSQELALRYCWLGSLTRSSVKGVISCHHGHTGRQTPAVRSEAQSWPLRMADSRGGSSSVKGVISCLS